MCGAASGYIKDGASDALQSRRCSRAMLTYHDAFSAAHHVFLPPFESAFLEFYSHITWFFVTFWTCLRVALFSMVKKPAKTQKEAPTVAAPVRPLVESENLFATQMPLDVSVDSAYEGPPPSTSPLLPTLPLMYLKSSRPRNLR